MSDVRLSDEYYHYLYDPSTQGYREGFWKTLTGTPSISSGLIRLNNSSIITNGEYMYGTVDLKLTIPAVPTLLDNRQFGLLSPANGNSLSAYFLISGTTFSAVSYGVWGSSVEQTTITWQAAWTATATVFSIKWFKEKVEFWVGGQKLATHITSIPGAHPLPVYMLNTNVDNTDVTYVSLEGIHKVVAPEMNVTVNVSDIEIGAVELKDSNSDTRAEIHAPVSAAMGMGLNTMPARYMATPPSITDTFSTPLLTDSTGNLKTVSPGDIPTTLTGGNTTVTTSGTAVALGTTLASKSIYIRAKSTNTGNIYVGDSTVDAVTNQQIILAANDSLSINIADRATVWIDAGVNLEGVDYLVMS